MQMKVYLHFKQWLEQTCPTTQAVFSDQTSWYIISRPFYITVQKLEISKSWEKS